LFSQQPAQGSCVNPAAGNITSCCLQWFSQARFSCMNLLQVLLQGSHSCPTGLYGFSLAAAASGQLHLSF
jgi:hypothetical protein